MPIDCYDVRKVLPPVSLENTRVIGHFYDKKRSCTLIFRDKSSTTIMRISSPHLERLVDNGFIKLETIHQDMINLSIHEGIVA